MHVFKLTPNQKDVVVNTDVLLNGYEDVQYPFTLKDAKKAQAGYIRDPETFKFTELTNIVDKNKPYPIRMEIIPKIKPLSFFGLNRAYSINNDSTIWVNSPNKKIDFKAKSKYDEAVFSNVKTADNLYSNEMQYEIKVRIYWSDGKSHSSSIDFSKEVSANVNYPFQMDIKIMGFNKIDAYTNKLVTNKLGDNNTVLFSIPLSKQVERKYAFSDNNSMYDIIAGNMVISATFMDPETHNSVSAYSKTDIIQKKFPGTLRTYAKVSCVYPKPLEVWTPTITEYGAKSLNEEANPKVDKNSLTEFYGFGISGEFIVDPNIESYNLKSENNTYKDIYLEGVIPGEYTIEKLDKVTSDDLGHFTCTGVRFDYYCTNNKDNVFSNEDASTFTDRYNLCKNYDDETYMAVGSKDGDPKQSKAWLDKTNFNNELVADSSYFATDQPLKLPNISDGIEVSFDKDPSIISAKGFYQARYAKYYIVNNNYYQIFNSNYYFKDNKDNFDIQTYKDYFETIKTVDTSTLNTSTLNYIRFDKVQESNPNSIISYKVLNDSTNNSVQFKYCVNRLNGGYVDPSTGKVVTIQVPMYGVYPLLTGYIPIDLLTYDYLHPQQQYHNIDLTGVSAVNIVTSKNGKVTVDTDKLKSACIQDNVSFVVLYKNEIVYMPSTDMNTSGLSLHPLIRGAHETYKAIKLISKSPVVDIPVQAQAQHDLVNAAVQVQSISIAYISQIRLQSDQNFEVDDFMKDFNYNKNKPTGHDKYLVKNLLAIYNKSNNSQSSNSVNVLNKNQEQNIIASDNNTISKDILTETIAKPIDLGYSKKDITFSLYKADGLNTAYKYKITFNLDNVSTNILSYLRVNGIPISDIQDTLYVGSEVDPGIFVISIDDYPYEVSEVISVVISKDSRHEQCVLLITNDENEKHLTSYEHDGDEINTGHHSSMLLRANPKLSGNVKLVVDTDYNLYLDTFKVNSTLNEHCYRKFPISTDGNYPRDIKSVFKEMPSNVLFAVPENSMNAHKVYTDFNDQYETVYEYGAETNKDNLYSENMKILAPLHIGNDVPEFFAIFRYNDVFNEETYNGGTFKDIDKFKTLIKDSEVVKTYDLRTHTSIGQYLNNYKDMLSNYGQCYLQFIEQDNHPQSPSYRQGNNIWKGISVKRGILADQSETTYFGSKILNDDSIKNKQEMFNNYIIAGFERHDLLYPNIINLEFMFNDPEMEEYSMNRYFGLYLTANDFIEYGYIVSDNTKNNNVLKKYDIYGNLYSGDKSIYRKIFQNAFKDRIFYAITNDNAARIQSETQLDNFLNKYVKNLPEKNIMSVKSDRVEFDKDDKSFITLHFSKPMKYGEHIKLIAMNRVLNSQTSGNTVQHIVYELIASNDERLITTDDNISPYVNVNTCEYSENTVFMRLSFYSQDIEYPSVPATIEQQIKRIIACIIKFNGVVKVSSHSNNSIAFVSNHDEMYLQHIAAPDFEDFKYDYLGWTNITSPKITTNHNYTQSIDFMPSKPAEPIYADHYNQADDKSYDWISSPVNRNNYYCYVEAEDPRNIIIDSISYFNADMQYEMHALSNQSQLFDNYYAAFSNYCFEMLGWRYNNVVPFKTVKSVSNAYVIYDDVQSIIKDIKYPLVLNTAGLYETLDLQNIKHGYLRNNIVEPSAYEAFIDDKQQFIFESTEISVSASPYDIDHTMIMSLNDILLTNNTIQLYKPKSVCISVMGISNIKDIDTNIEVNRNVTRKTNLDINIGSNETIKLDESDYRIQHGVMYLLKEGNIKIDNSHYITQGLKFIVIKNTVYIESGLSVVADSFTTTAETVLQIVDRQYYQDYDYSTQIPTLKIANYFKDVDNINTSDLVYPIVPLVHCAWKSNGEYFDNNSVLDVNTLNFDYEPVGNFTESVYNASEYDVNQYITNKIDNILYVNGKPMSFKECILNNSVQHPIKKMLIDNVNLSTASAYYNANIQSLEFIFAGIKYTIKLNSKLVNSFIHLEDYTGYEVFVVCDYNLAKRNELYISLKEKFILIVNHQFYTTYAHEGANNVKVLNTGNYKGYADYAAFAAPYSIDFAATASFDYSVNSHIKEGSIHKSLMSVIDEHNLWNSLFVQYDVPTLDRSSSNNPQFISSYIESISEFDNYVTFDRRKYDVGLLNASKGVTKENVDDILSTESISHPFVVTKADKVGLTESYSLLKQINDKIKYAGVNTKNSEMCGTDIEFDGNITVNEALLHGKIADAVISDLSEIVNKMNIEFVINKDNMETYNVISISDMSLNKLKDYITKLITSETDREKLERYVKTFDDNIDIYIIPDNSDVKYIKNTTSYNPLIFTLSIPNEVKFNYGWFTPNTNNMVDFYVDDELRDILNVDLMLSNTKIKGVNSLTNYTGNKVFEDAHMQSQTLDANYFLVPTRSILSAPWDPQYYRLYTSDNSYINKEGNITGIDDKSFFGSHCMVFRNEYLALNKWSYDTANDIYTKSERDDEHNMNSTNERCVQIDIDLQSAIFNHFINNKAFIENWSKFKQNQHTGMKNYIQNTIMSFYNMNSEYKVELYVIDTDKTLPINIVEEKPADMNNYYLYENYTTKLNSNVLTIIINKTTGFDVYPVIKIYRK